LPTAPRFPVTIPLSRFAFNESDPVREDRSAAEVEPEEAGRVGVVELKRK
jgi:hypothetical protein